MPRKYEANWYQSPLNLPARRLGTAEVKHRIIPAGEDISIVGMRQAMLRGIRPVSGKTAEPLTIHELYEVKGARRTLWMTDLPEELNQIKELMHAINPGGTVCVGGLGLGILALTVAQSPFVEAVTVVERNKDIIALCADPAQDYTVVHDDINEFVQKDIHPYDTYLLDTWGPTNEGVWWDEVMPLCRAIRNRFGATPVIHCWAEDIMLGQIVASLRRNTGTWYYKYLPVPMPARQAARFVKDVGLPAWEERYGKAIDQGIADMQAKRKEA